MRRAQPNRAHYALAELEQILLFNEQHGIEVFRIGSSLVPFASHKVNTLQWWKLFARTFEHLARIARRSHQRLSLHPSPAGASLIQTTSGSCRPSVAIISLSDVRPRTFDDLTEAEEAALEACQIRHGSPCIVVAVDDEVRISSPTDAVRRDMPRVRYAGTFDPARIVRA